MRNKILHLADLHLGDGHDYLGARAPERRREADDVLRRVVDWALRPASEIGGVILAGDLFDHHSPALPLIEAVLTDLGRLLAAGIRVLTVPGNHDELSYVDSVYRRFGDRWPDTLVTQPSLGRVASWTLGATSIDLYSMAFVQGRSRAPFEACAIEPGTAKRIAVLHGSLDVEWSDRSIPLRSAALAEHGFAYVALGHIHKPRDLRLGTGWACYPGRIEGAGFDDPGGAGLVVIDTSAAELRPLRLEFPSRTIDSVSLDLSGITNEAELVTRLEHEVGRDAGRILRLVLEGAPGCDVDATTLTGKLTGRSFHIEFDDSRLLNIDLQSGASESTIRGTFLRRMHARIESATSEEERRRAELALRFGAAAFARTGEPSA